MTRLRHLLAAFRRDTSGANAIEYGLLMAGIALTIIVAVDQLGSNVLSQFYERIAESFT